MTKQEILKIFALEIQRHEGYFAPSILRPLGSRAWRNKNPGNLKTGFKILYKGQVGWDYSGFAKFLIYEAGFDALLFDIEAKFTGKTRTGLGPNSTILKFFEVYAPAADSNNPYRYAMAVVQGLAEKGLKVSVYDTLGKLLSLADRQKQELKILVAFHSVPQRNSFEPLLGGLANYLENAFEGTIDVSVDSIDLAETIKLKYIERNIQVGTGYEVRKFEVVDPVQIAALIEGKIKGHKILHLIDSDGRGLTSSLREFIKGAVINQHNVVPNMSEASFLENLVHETLHSIYTLINKNGGNLVDEVHNYSGLFDARPEARYTALVQKIKSQWQFI